MGVSVPDQGSGAAGSACEPLSLKYSDTGASVS